VPSQSPSTFGSRRFVLCPLDDCELHTATTVDEVNSALVEIGKTMDDLLNSDPDHDVYDMFKNVANVLQEKGGELRTSSIALSRSPTTDSEDQITQTLILEEVKETSAKIGSLYSFVRQEFVPVRAKIFDPKLDEIMLRLQSITGAYTSFIKTREEPNKGSRDNAMNQLR
jgi:hypothetical protein